MGGGWGRRRRIANSGFTALPIKSKAYHQQQVSVRIQPHDVFFSAHVGMGGGDIQVGRRRRRRRRPPLPPPPQPPRGLYSPLEDYIILYRRLYNPLEDYIILYRRLYNPLEDNIVLYRTI